MGHIRIHTISRRDAGDMYAAVEEHVALHYPECEVDEHRRIVSVKGPSARDVFESLIADGILDPTEHDYSVDSD